MRAGDLADEAVRAQEREEARDAAGLAATFDRVVGGGMECGAQVTVAEALYSPFPA